MALLVSDAPCHGPMARLGAASAKQEFLLVSHFIYSLLSPIQQQTCLPPRVKGTLNTRAPRGASHLWACESRSFDVSLAASHQPRKSSKVAHFAQQGSLFKENNHAPHVNPPHASSSKITPRPARSCSPTRIRPEPAASARSSFRLR